MQNDRATDTAEYPQDQGISAADWFDESYCARLGELNSDLGGVAECAERQFLAIGARLRDFHARAAEVSQQAVKTADALTGEKYEKIRGRMQTLLERLDQHLEQAKQRSERGNHILGNLLEQLEKLLESLSRYHDIAKTLHFLAISTLIESSTLESTEGFQTLGVALKNLEQAMLTKVNKVWLQLEALASLCRTVRSEVHLNDLSRLRLIGQSDKLTRSLLAAAAQKNLLAAESAQALAERSNTVAAGIGEIVSSMQYHDITRQQIDHVRSALTNLAEGLGQTTHQEPLSHQAAQVQVLDEACRLQSAHLRHADTELNAAVTRIIDSLREISGAVSSTATDMRWTAGSVQREGTSAFVELDTALTNISEALIREILAGQETERAISATVNNAAQMTELIQEINQIGVEMKMIALNAGISAFHSSGNYPALAVAAEGIQRLTERVFSQTTDMETSLTQIIEMAQGLNSSTTPIAEYPTEQVLDLSQEASELLRLLRQLNDQSVERLNKMEGLANGLTKEIEQAIAMVTIHETSHQVTSRVAYGLDEISQRASKLPRSLKKSAGDSYLQNLRDQYTMQSERDIFSSIRDNESGNGESANMPPAPFGDNIEIF